jgi:hypothetical protein
MATPKPVGAWDKSPTNTGRLVSSSPIKAANPFGGSQARQYTNVASPFAGRGNSAGDRSLQAFGQAAQMQQRGESQKSLEDLGVSYQNKAQELRAADVYNQRADQVRRFGFSEAQRADRRAQNVNREQQLLNYQNQIAEARANANQNLANSMFSLIAGGGVLSGLSTVGALRASMPKSMYGGGMGLNAFYPGWSNFGSRGGNSGGGIFGGLFGR